MGALPPALAQVVAGLAAHSVAAGCLPAARTLLAVPAALAAVLLTGWALPRSPLLRLAGGQLAVHGVLALAACAGAAHVPAAETSSAAMTGSHVLALVACRAGLDRVVLVLLRVLAERLVAVPAVLCRVPQVPHVAAVHLGPVLSASRVLGVAPGRGPPARLLPA